MGTTTTARTRTADGAKRVAGVGRFECVELVDGRHGTVRSVAPAYLAVHFCDTARTERIPRGDVLDITLGSRHGCRIKTDDHASVRRRRGQHECCGGAVGDEHLEWCDTPRVEAARAAAGEHPCCGGGHAADGPHAPWCRVAPPSEAA